MLFDLAPAPNDGCCRLVRYEIRSYMGHEWSHWTYRVKASSKPVYRNPFNNGWDLTYFS